MVKDLPRQGKTSTVEKNSENDKGREAWQRAWPFGNEFRHVWESTLRNTLLESNVLRPV